MFLSEDLPEEEEEEEEGWSGQVSTYGSVWSRQPKAKC